jgi:hypothetical protein
MKIEHKTFDAEIKTADDSTLTIEHWISTEEKDRGGDIMVAAGMKIQGKPVVMFAHGRGPMGTEPVAKPMEIRADTYRGKTGVIAKTRFFPDAVGQRLYEKVRDGYLPNFSIGYGIIEAKDLLKDGRFDGRLVSKWYLYEYSLAPVPMNAGATTFKDGGDALCFKLLPDDDAEGYCGECKGDVKCAEHREKVDPTKPEMCPTCKAQVVVFTKDGSEIGKACEKCQAEEYARLLKAIEEKPFANEHACRVKDPDQFPKKRRENNKFGDGIHAIWGIRDDKAELQAIRFSAEKFTADQAKKWAKDHDHTCTPFEPATGKEEQYPEAEPELLAKIAEEEKHLTIEIRVTGLEEAIASMNEAIKTMTETYMKLEPLLKALPPEPDGGDKGKEGDPNNPPEKKPPPRLVIVREEESPVAKTKAAILAVAKEAMADVLKQEFDKMRGRVP